MTYRPPSRQCSEAQRNVNIIFTSDKGGSFVLRRVVVRAPGTNFTAPVHTGLVFVFRERPTFAMLQAFNDYTKERFLAAKAAAERSKKFDGVPVGFFTVSGHSASATIDLPPYAAGSFVVVRAPRRCGQCSGLVALTVLGWHACLCTVQVKLIDATGSGTNIDCEYIGLFADEAVCEQIVRACAAALRSVCSHACSQCRWTAHPTATLRSAPCYRPLAICKSRRCVQATPARENVRVASFRRRVLSVGSSILRLAPQQPASGRRQFSARATGAACAAAGQRGAAANVPRLDAPTSGAGGAAGDPARLGAFI